MENTNEKEEVRGAGTDFTKQQRAVDQAINERIKTELGTEKIDPELETSKKNRDHKTDLSVKKTGGGKQSNPGS